MVYLLTLPKSRHFGQYAVHSGIRTFRLYGRIPARSGGRILQYSPELEDLGVSYISIYLWCAESLIEPR